MTEFYYRYYDDWWNESSCIIRYERFCVVKRTPKGAWVEEMSKYKPKRRFVLDNARRRFAYPTKELAANSYRIRKKWQITHCERTISKARAVLKQLEQTPVPLEPLRYEVNPIAIEWSEV